MQQRELGELFQLCDSSSCPSGTASLSRGGYGYKVLADKAWGAKALLFQVTLLHVISLGLHISLAFAEKNLHM